MAESEECAAKRDSSREEHAWAAPNQHDTQSDNTESVKCPPIAWPLLFCPVVSPD